MSDCTVFTCAGCMRCFFENNSQNDCLLEVFRRAPNLQEHPTCEKHRLFNDGGVLYIIFYCLDICESLDRMWIWINIVDSDILGWACCLHIFIQKLAFATCFRSLAAHCLVWWLPHFCHGAICRLTLKNLFFPAKNIHRQQQHPKGCSNEGHGFSFQKTNSRSKMLEGAHNLPNIFDMNVTPSNMNKGSAFQLCIFCVGCHSSDSHLALQPVDDCKWLVYVASLLAPKPHLLLLIGFDIVKTLPRCYLKTYIEEAVFPAKNIHRQQQRIPFDAAAMKATAFHSRKDNPRSKMLDFFGIFRSKSST